MSPGATTGAHVSVANVVVAKPAAVVVVDGDSAKDNSDTVTAITAGADTNGKKNNDNEADITATHTPQSEEVKFNQLALYDTALLCAGVYYNADDDNQKPVSLALMGYGVPDFTDPEDDIVLARSVGRSSRAFAGPPQQLAASSSA